jgi:predicted RND superfamily exporter protein
MWKYLTRVLLRNRLAILIIIVLLTAFMGWMGSGVKLSYDNASLLPSDDSFIVDYNAFKTRFGEDGSMRIQTCFN